MVLVVRLGLSGLGPGVALRFWDVFAEGRFPPDVRHVVAGFLVGEVSISPWVPIPAPAPNIKHTDFI